MKTVTFSLIIAFSLVKAHAQFVHLIEADSVLITNDSSRAELNLENNTKHITGFLYNRGNGRTEFRKMLKLNDSTLVLGGDTIKVGGNSKNFANADLTFTGNRIHDLAGNDLTLKSNSTAFGCGTEFYQNSGVIWLLAYVDSLNKWDNFGTLVADNQLSYTMHYDNQIYKSESGFSNSADQVSLYSRPLRLPYYKANEIYIDTSAIRLIVNKDSSLMIYPIKVRPNDTGYEPLMVDNGGDLYKLSQLPSSQFTLQQVLDSGNTTSNTIKPYPNALPTGSNSDSVVVWCASDSLLKKKAPLQTFAQTATVTVSNTTSETTLIGSGTGSLVIPSAAWAVGKSFEVAIQGIYSTDNAHPANITLRLKLGSTIIASTGTITLNANRTNIPFDLHATITCRTTGASGTIYTFGDMYRDGKINAVNNGASASTINTTISQTLSATVQLSDSSNGNSFSAFVITLEPVN